MTKRSGAGAPASGRNAEKTFPALFFDEAKIRIMQTAESLFADRTIDSVSLREIAARSGNGNTNAVQYHFGSKDALVQDIFAWRVWQMEEPRGRALADAEAQGRLNDPATLVRILCLPLLDLKDTSGKHSYAAFMSQYLLRQRPAGVLHAVDRADGFNRNIKRLIDLIFTLIRATDRVVHDYRLALTHLIFANTVVMSDQEGLVPGDPVFAQRIENALRMATAALTAAIEPDRAAARKGPSPR